MKDIFLGAALLIGTIIGAGVFSLPYSYSLSGFPLGVLSLIIAEILLIITSLLLVEMGRKGEEIPDIIERYLGKFGKYMTSLSLILLAVGAISAYNRGIGESFEVLIGIDGKIIMAFIAFFVAFLSYKGVRSVVGSEGLLVVFLILFMVFLTLIALPDIKVENLKYINPRYFFYALGASIFAASGYSAVPELLKIEDKRKCVVAVLLAHLFVFILYFSFSMAFVGKFGKSVRQIAVENLEGYIKEIGLLTAAMAMLTSYISLAFVLYNVYKDSLRIPWYFSMLLTFVLPYIIAFFSRAGFADIISMTGGIAMPLTGLLVGLAYWKHSKDVLGRFLGTAVSGIYIVLLVETFARMML